MQCIRCRERGSDTCRVRLFRQGFLPDEVFARLAPGAGPSREPPGRKEPPEPGASGLSPTTCSNRAARQRTDFDPFRAGGWRLPGLPGRVHDRYWMLRAVVYRAFEHGTGRHARDPAALGTGPRAAIEREAA